MYNNKEIKLKTIFLLFITLICGLWACNDQEDCTVDANFDQMRVQFFDFDALEVRLIKFDSIKAVNSDSLFFTDEDSLSVFSLSLSPFEENATFLFYSPTQTDSLEIQYKVQYSIISEICGPTTSYSQLNLIYHTFDSASVVNTFFDTNLTANIEVYF